MLPGFCILQYGSINNDSIKKSNYKKLHLFYSSLPVCNLYTYCDIPFLYYELSTIPYSHCISGYFIDHSGRKVTYAGARVPLFYRKSGILHKKSGDKQSIGYKDSINDYDFKNHTINVDQLCSFYLRTDGYTDQLGGDKRLRLGTKKFKQLIMENHDKSYAEQREIFYRL